MSTKRLARTVIDGVKLSVANPTGMADGYLAGIDDYTYLLIDSDGVRRLVHKAGAIVTFGDPSYDTEPKREELEELISPFRDWVRRELLHQTGPAREKAS